MPSDQASTYSGEASATNSLRDSRIARGAVDENSGNRIPNGRTAGVSHLSKERCSHRRRHSFRTRVHLGSSAHPIRCQSSTCWGKSRRVFWIRAPHDKRRRVPSNRHWLAAARRKEPRPHSGTRRGAVHGCRLREDSRKRARRAPRQPAVEQGRLAPEGNRMLPRQTIRGRPGQTCRPASARARHW